MTFTILSNNEVETILETLNLDELEEFQHGLASALHEFSTDAQADENSSYQQPHRITTYHSATEATTLYMPSCAPAGMGCKGMRS